MNETSVVGKAKAKLKSGKTLEILTVMVLAIIVIAVLALSFREDTARADALPGSYASEMEEKLSAVLSQIQGAGKVEVIVTAQSEGETVLAMETVVSKDGNITTKPVLVGGAVVVLEVKNPEITGVLIVAEGANDLNVRFSLLEATASVLNINQSIIKVYTKGGCE